MADDIDEFLDNYDESKVVAMIAEGLSQPVPVIAVIDALPNWHIVLFEGTNPFFQLQTLEDLDKDPSFIVLPLRSWGLVCNTEYYPRHPVLQVFKKLPAAFRSDAKNSVLGKLPEWVPMDPRRGTEAVPIPPLEIFGVYPSSDAMTPEEVLALAKEDFREKTQSIKAKVEYEAAEKKSKDDYEAWLKDLRNGIRRPMPSSSGSS